MVAFTSAYATSNAGLSEDQLYNVARSIFATDKHHSRSDRFQPIPTIDALRALSKEGFVPVYAAQQITRDETRRPFAKHLVRLRHIGSDGRRLTVNGTHGEVVLKNGNDGSSSYQLLSGLFRTVCMNGLITYDEKSDEVRVRHSGDVVSKVIEGTYRVLDETEVKLAAPTDWSNVQLGRDEQLALASAAHVVRFADAEGNVDTPIRAEQLLTPRRFEDRNNSLWEVWNRVQENALRGGLTAWNRSTQRRTTTREIKGIDSDVKLNKALWVLGEHLYGAVKSQAAA